MDSGPFRIGQVVAEIYEITGVLGSGGMGVVYDARDTILARHVAIKTPRLPECGPALRREAQALAAIASPSFVRVHHVAREGEMDLLVMERLYGETLQDRLDALRPQLMSIDEVIRHLIAIASALSDSHRIGIAQRDLKPSNVVLTGDRTVIIDFGLFVPEVLVSEDDPICGSPQYMAPEVILKHVVRGGGPFVDLYALGIVAFELLTGATPYGEKSIEKMLLNHISEPIPNVADYRDGVPRDLAALVSELLAKEPRDRPPGAEALLWQLEHIRDRRAARGRRMKVIAIDDDAHVGTALKRSLESAFPRLEVEVSTDPNAASRALASHPPDVALVDLNMPGANGIEVCMRILQLPPEMRPVVVAMSAQAEPRDVQVLRALGVEHFVAKDEGFLAAVGTVLGALRS